MGLTSHPPIYRLVTHSHSHASHFAYKGQEVVIKEPVELGVFQSVQMITVHIGPHGPICTTGLLPGSGGFDQFRAQVYCPFCHLGIEVLAALDHLHVGLGNAKHLLIFFRLHMQCLVSSYTFQAALEFFNFALGK